MSRAMKWSDKIVVLPSRSVPESQFDVLAVDLYIRGNVLEHSRHVYWLSRQRKRNKSARWKRPERRLVVTRSALVSACRDVRSLDTRKLTYVGQA